MSGILALFHLDERPVESGLLSALADTLSHRGPDGLQMWHSGAAGLACQFLRVTPESSGEVRVPRCGEDVVISLDGRVDNREELLAVLVRGVPGRAISDPELILSAYLRYGDSFAQHVNGEYAVAIFDIKQQKLLLSRDIIGTRPLYYWHARDTFIAASEIKAILAHPAILPEPDDDGLADFVLGGEQNRIPLTCFRGIYRVLPGETVVATRAHVRCFKHWQFDFSKQVRYQRVHEYAEALQEIFAQAVRRRTCSSYPIAVLVSGGLDSSAILCQAEKLREMGVSLPSVLGLSMIFPAGTAADEKSFLLPLESQYKVEIRRIPFSSFAFRDDFLWNTETPRMQWDANVELLALAQRSSCRVVLDGDYGDQLMFSDAHLIELARRFRFLRLRNELAARAASMKDVQSADLNRYHLNVLLRNLVPSWLVPAAKGVRRIFNPRQYAAWYTDSFRRRAYRRNRGSRKPYLASKQTENCYEFITQAHTLNGIEEANKFAAAYQLEAAHPFLDRDLIAFMMAIPADIASWGGAGKGLFREAMRGILPDSIRNRDWKADFTAISNESVANHFEKWSDILNSDCFAVKRGYIDPASLSAELVRHKSRLAENRSAPGNWVTGTVGLELWLRLFFSKVS